MADLIDQYYKRRDLINKAVETMGEAFTPCMLDFLLNSQLVDLSTLKRFIATRELKRRFEEVKHNKKEEIYKAIASEYEYTPRYVKSFNTKYQAHNIECKCSTPHSETQNSEEVLEEAQRRSIRLSQLRKSA